MSFVAHGHTHPACHDYTSCSHRLTDERFVQAIPSYDKSNANNNLGSIQAKQGSSTQLVSITFVAAIRMYRRSHFSPSAAARLSATRSPIAPARCLCTLVAVTSLNHNLSASVLFNLTRPDLIRSDSTPTQSGPTRPNPTPHTTQRMLPICLCVQGLVRTMILQDLPKIEGPVNRQSAKVLRQDVKKRLQQLAAAEATDPALYNGVNQGTWETEKAEYQNRLNTIEANCKHCEAKEGDLDTAYDTAGNAHTRVMNILTQINLVNDAQVLYDQYLGMTTGGGNGFNEALKVLKDTSNGFNNPLADHTSTSSDLQAVPSNLQQLVDDVNTKALAARNQHTALVGAKTASVNSGLCQQSGGGVNEECTSSHLDRAGGARLAAIDADAAVLTAKVHVWACH